MVEYPKEAGTMRKKIDPAIKARAALDALKGELTIAEIAAKYCCGPALIGLFA